ncbi:ATP-grasp domain-containing protein [Actinoplanes sp. NPDC049118]|uniref:ATP-grasp domain-containing protein n=1 Tax=Actinoplanes sp. NPDC049118 TaxID=3155769 RepID=UPI0033F2E587
MSYIVVINPVKTGAKYKKEVHDKGFQLLSVYAFSRELLDERWPGYADGDDVTVHARDVSSIVRELAPYRDRTVAVVPGEDSSVSLADEVAEALGLPGNGSELSKARNHKDAMRALAERAGLRIPRWRLVGDATDIPAAAREVGFPAIVKHTAGGGSHGAMLIPDEAALAGLGALQRTDHYLEPVRQWLVEQYVRGREIAVNAISFEGVHHIVDMWHYSQPDDGDYDFPYWDNVQMSRSDLDWAAVAEFAERVLDVYGIRLGPSHTEVKVATDGVYLIETAARLGGGPFTEMWMAHSDFNPFAADIDCRLGRRPAKFGTDVAFDAAFGAIAIRNDGPPGILREIKGLMDFQSAPGVERVLVAYAPGDAVPTTDSTRTIPLGAWVHGRTPAEVRSRLADLRALVHLDIDRTATGAAGA